jgi:hypothetical protein
MIRNEPTTSAMPANTSRKIVMNRIARSSWLAATSAALSPVMARASAGSTDATLSRSCCWETPSSAVTQIVLKAVTALQEESLRGLGVPDRRGRAVEGAAVRGSRRDRPASG